MHLNKIFSQADRQGRLSTILSKDALVLLRMDGTEELSGDFTWRVEALSDDPALDLHGLLGTHATVEVDHADGTRAFDGIVCEAEARGASENGHRYDLILRPWLHVAGLRRNMRIFHDKTVVQIVEEVLGAYAHLGDPHLDVQVTGEYPVLEYTVQYGESDADFMRRQLERHGISWSWRHVAGSHTLLLTDAAFSLPEVPGAARPYYGVAGYHRHEEEHFRLWTAAERITTGAVRLTEYNFKTPSASQEVEQAGEATHPNGDMESYDWPGDYLDQGAGRDVVARRTDAARGQAPRHRAEGDVASLGAGWRVTLKGDDVPGATGRTFVCLKAEHRFRAQGYGSGDSGGDETPYDGSYVLMPDDTPYRPEQRTVGPKVQGPETAVVVGEGEIDCDVHGRIRVQFHWDLDAAHTMWVRVSQNWAGKGWGGMVIPRIGMEVIVEHLRGDPDKPIVTGCVYNGKNTPPYELPEHKTRSTFKTDTHQGEGFNELRFEDEKDKEEIFLHAQKDHNTTILHNESHQIGNDRSKLVGNDQKERVNRDKQIDVGRDHVETIGQDEKKTVMRNAERQVDKDSFDYVNNHRIEYTYANHQEEVGAHHYMKVEGDSEVAVGQKLFTRSKMQVLHAKDKFIIGGPGGTIEINSSGVVIRANKIDLKGPVNVTAGAPDQIASLESAINEGLDLAEVCIRKLTDE
ncbi:type VI secretion system secreted protein VgrG [Yoonia maricola]|uniref:Type VI secretion system secreted protein VgrG n=1 Tax=Yoonia maricola TaxID=420999 RepID=A0A2M8W1W7_9RHOB|nr:type VI secretion system tip protein TssI/VgrG [Yoonia maricola]PJI84914.1 type VI secretion system secreted protein VgrG [Yoonia maricola]